MKYRVESDVQVEKYGILHLNDKKKNVFCASISAAKKVCSLKDKEIFESSVANFPNC